MSGWVEAYRDGARPRFWKIEIATEDGGRVAMTDPRRLGRIRLRDEPLLEPPLAGLGKDALDELPSAAGLGAALSPTPGSGEGGAPRPERRSRASATGSPTRSCIRPASIPPAARPRSTPAGEVTRCGRRSPRVVRRAVNVGADDARLPRTWLFHHRWGKKKDARTARGERIVHLTVGGRTTAFVPDRQR